MNDRASGGPLEHSELVAQGDVLEEQDRAGKEVRTDRAGSELEQRHPGPPCGQGGHSVRDPMPPPFIDKLL